MNKLITNSIKIGLTGATIYAMTKDRVCSSSNGIALMTGASTFLMTILIKRNKGSSNFSSFNLLYIL